MHASLRFLTMGAVALGLFGCSKSETPAAAAAGAIAPAAVAPAATLPPEDVGFVDKRDGWDWSDRCWKSLGANRLAAARAECAKGLELAHEGKPARPSLLYNSGLVEERSGNTAGAKAFFEQSLALRPNAEVAAALGRVGGTPPAAPKAAGVKKSIKCGNTTCDKVCCETSGKCAQDVNSCERATNGEGTIYECDGPEDCALGEVCCKSTMDRTVASRCTAKGSCKGTFHHPRYDQDFPDAILCHASADCVNGGTCASGECAK